MNVDEVDKLISQLADLAEEQGMRSESLPENCADPGGMLHQFVVVNCVTRSGTEFFVVMLLAAELADRAARRQGYLNQFDRAASMMQDSMKRRGGGPMKVEYRSQVGPDGIQTPRGLVLIAESDDESRLIDQVCGNEVGDDGLIAKVQAEVRLSDGYGEHYIYIPASQPMPASDLGK